MGNPLTRLALLALVAFAAAGVAFARPASQANACGAYGPFDFDTYEAEDYITDYGHAIQIAAEGKAGLPPYAVSGETVDLSYQGLKTGPRNARTTTADPSLRLPPSVYKSIVWVESVWSNASGLVPFGGVGPALVSPDCGYGLAQVTSGMANTSGGATAKQAAIGTHPLFNLAEGARILADKWNSAPRFRPIAGTGDPAALEDWYFAIWSYNGFAFSNHPLNPNRDPLRAGASADGPIYHCYEPTAPSYQNALFGYGDYTYPERVYGCMRFPPMREGRYLYDAQTFSMPDLTNPVVAAAFAPEHFLACEEGGFESGCPEMDFPTTVEDNTDTPANEARIPHADSTPAFDPAWLGKWLGDPVFEYNAPYTMVLTASTDGKATSGTAIVRNVGAGIGPFRVRTSHVWIVAQHVNDPFPRSIDGSVAVGQDTEVVLQRQTDTQPRMAQKGYDSVLRITLDTRSMPDGLTVGYVQLEPLLGSGGVFTIEVIATKGASGLAYDATLPGLTRDP
ncbi:MAG TPA: hypothetical protein VFY90_13825 [Tepidiformaceae bacterium]|nr:hypothetical protein [Tepidiformaceae bacterium]